MAMAFLSCPAALFLPSPPSASLRSSFKGSSLHLHPRTAPPAQAFSCRPPFSPLPLVAHQGYKMKSHKAAAKRFRVTGSGKIFCRRAAKQHLLGKKTATRRRRLSKMALVEKCDYQNITHALPYLKIAK